MAGYDSPSLRKEVAGNDFEIEPRSELVRLKSLSPG